MRAAAAAAAVGRGPRRASGVLGLDRWEGFGEGGGPGVWGGGVWS